MIQQHLPMMCGDPGMFSIPCTIGTSHIPRAMLDLGASINIMPKALYDEMNIGPLAPTRIAIQLADLSTVWPEGLLEDVLVKVGDLIFPADFYVLNTGKATTRNPTILLGRPFLKTANTKIDCETGKLTCAVAGEIVTFEAYNQETPQRGLAMVNTLDIIDEVVEEVWQHDEKQEEYDNLLTEADEELEIIEECNYVHNGGFSSQRFEELQIRDIRPEDRLVPSLERAPKLELKTLPKHLKYSYLGKDETLPIIISADLDDSEEVRVKAVLDTYKEAIGWTLADIKGISPTDCMHHILLEEEAVPVRDPQRRLNPAMKEVVMKEILKLLDLGIIYPVSDSRWVSPVHVVPKKSGIQVVENEKREMIATRLQTGWRVCIDYRKLNQATRKDHFPLPFIDEMLERLAGNMFYCFLDGYSGYMQIWVAEEDQGKTTFTCPFGTFAYRRMPFGLCNAPGTFQRCMMSIFSDLLEECIEVFMDDFTVYGKSFEACLVNLEKVMKRCVEKSLVLNYEKCHFMVKEGIVLGHVISERGIEVDKAKIDIIAKLPYPTSVKQLRGFLGHAGFYRRFVKDFAKMAQPMTRLLQNEVPWDFNDECKEAFHMLKENLVTAPIIQPPDWGMPFELMCDASGYAVGAVLGQKIGKERHVIYYASKTLNAAQSNYATTEKELLAIVFAFEKFRSYLLGGKTTVYTDHAALRYLMTKKETKPRLMRWILLLQEFDVEIVDKSGAQN